MRKDWCVFWGEMATNEALSCSKSGTMAFMASI
jgi:hypothetical protein